MRPRHECRDDRRNEPLLGLPLIWVVSPTARTVRILRSNGMTTILREGDELSGEDVVPGFVCPVAAIFPPRAPAAPAEAKPAS